MRWIIRLIFLAGACLAGMPAQAAEPYEKIPVKLSDPARPGDGLRAFLAELTTAAKSRDRKALAPHVAEDFFWERDFGLSFDAKAPAVKNFETALTLNEADLAPEFKNIGWERLTELLAARSFSRHEKRPGVVCGPGVAEPPDWDKAAGIAENMGSDFSFEWAYVEDGPVQFYDRPDKDGTVVAQLSWQAVRVVDLGDAAKTDGPPRAQDWIKVQLPSGKRAYVLNGQTLSFLTDRLCYRKNAGGAWQIAGYVGGGD